MKRQHPKLNRPYKRGDIRPDGRMFYKYDMRRFDVDGYYKEEWLRPVTTDWHRARRREYAKEKPALHAAHGSKRRAAKLQRTPPWLSADQLDQMKALYQLAADLTISTGVVHHVDHIVPLQGKRVSGLHVPWNLQVLTARENISKGNRHSS